MTLRRCEKHLAMPGLHFATMSPGVAGGWEPDHGTVSIFLIRF